MHDQIWDASVVTMGGIHYALLLFVWFVLFDVWAGDKVGKDEDEDERTKSVGTMTISYSRAMKMPERKNPDSYEHFSLYSNLF